MQLRLIKYNQHKGVLLRPPLHRLFSLGQFDKQAETLELLLGDRTAQLEAMPTHAPNAEANTELLRLVKVRVSRKNFSDHGSFQTQAHSSFYNRQFNWRTQL